MIDCIEMFLTYNNLSVSEIFDLLDKNETLYLLSFIKGINLNMKSNSSNYILSEDNRNIINHCRVLKKTDIEILIKFFTGLGKSDTSGQISNCRLYKEMFTNEYNIISKEEKNQGKCLSTIILGCGFLIILLML